MRNYKVEIDIGGKKYQGNVTEEDGMVTVMSYDVTTPPQSGSYKGDSRYIAELILREMVRQSKNSL